MGAAHPVALPASEPFDVAAAAAVVRVVVVGLVVRLQLFVAGLERAEGGGNIAACVVEVGTWVGSLAWAERSEERIVSLVEVDWAWFGEEDLLDGVVVEVVDDDAVAVASDP